MKTSTALSPGTSESTAISAIPQFTDELVSSGRTVPLVATATLDGSSIFDLWWKSGSTTGGAARSAPSTRCPSAVIVARPAGSRVGSSKTVGGTSTVPSRTRTSSGGLASVVMLYSQSVVGWAGQKSSG